MSAFIQRYWYLLLALASGVIAAVVLLGPSLVAQATATTTMRARPVSAFVALGLGAAAGALGVPLLDEDTIVLVIGGLLGVGVILGWVLAFENNAFRLAGWFKVLGPIQPVPDRMASPVRNSLALTTLLGVVGIMGGACVR